MIKFVDMFSGIGGFREGLTRAGGFECVGHCEIDKYANRSYNALFDTKGEWFIEDARKADPSTMPDFQLLCGGFPCQTFSIAGSRKGFGDPRGTLFFELARLAEARKPSYLLFENVPGLLSHDGGRTFATILNTLDRLGYGVEWQCLNSKDFGVPQSRNRVYIIGYLDERCRGKVFPFTETAGSSLIQTHGGHQGERVYSPEGLSCTLAANPGGFGGKTGLYEVGVPIKCATKTGYQMAQVGDSIDLSYATVNSRRGRVGKEIAHTLTTGCQQGTVEVRPVKNPIKSDLARNTERTGKPGAPMHTLTTKDRHGVLYEGRIRRLTPRECLRLQGWADDRIDTVLAIQSDNQAYKQAGNGVTVHVVEAIGRRIAKPWTQNCGVRRLPLDFRDQYFGCEIELTGINRATAAQTLADLFGTRAEHSGGGYDAYRVKDLDGKEWKIVRDGSIHPECRRRSVLIGETYKVELNSPKLEYGEMEKLQEVVRALRRAGGIVNDSCGMHVHVDASKHTPQSLKNVLSIMYSKEDILFAALKVNPARIDSYCQAVDEPILEEIRKLPSGASMDQLKDRWYQGRDGSDYHYHSKSRYQGLLWQESDYVSHVPNFNCTAAKIIKTVCFSLHNNYII